MYTKAIKQYLISSRDAEHHLCFRGVGWRAMSLLEHASLYIMVMKSMLYKKRLFWFWYESGRCGFYWVSKTANISFLPINTKSYDSESLIIDLYFMWRKRSWLIYNNTYACYILDSLRYTWTHCVRVVFMAYVFFWFSIICYHIKA